MRLFVALLLFVASSASGQTLLATVPIFDYPQAMAVNTFTDRAYVLEESANVVTEIDGLTNSAIKIPLPPARQQSLNGAIAINQFTNKIYVVDGVNNVMSVLVGCNSRGHAGAGRECSGRLGGQSLHQQGLRREFLGQHRDRVRR